MKNKDNLLMINFLLNLPNFKINSYLYHLKDFRI